MKNWKKIFIGIVILVISLSFVYAFLVIKIKFILAHKLESAFGRKVSIGQLKLKPPLNLELINLDVDGLVNIGYVYISPSIPNLLSGKLALNKVRIVSPKISCERSLPTASVATDSAVILNKPKADKPVEETPAVAQSSLKLIIKSLKVMSGEINFIDHTADSRNVTVVINNIDLNLKDLYTYPVDVVFNFNLNGRLPWKSGEPDGKIYLEGWVNPYKKDMSADLRVEDIDAIAFYPYYSTWVDLEKARIDKAKLNFSSQIRGENNNISAQCHLELADIVRKVRSPEEPQQKAERLTDAVLDMFKAMNQGKVVLDFTLHTKMDHPQFGFENIKSAFEGKLMEARTNSGLRPQDMLLWPGKMLQGGIKNGTDLTKAAVDGVFALGEGLKKFFEDAMNKQASED
ncbi:MAG: DUF748 domain-containing protein [Candidatus Omnitrophica bacterium]|nr:DUF748 domain-containing protein [Candidatus Omnitrophota bacterium]MBU1924182.1 DUF748 domain-containing protein [Candidatus Omnitrophota bacterium]